MYTGTNETRKASRDHENRAYHHGRPGPGGGTGGGDPPGRRTGGVNKKEK